MRILFRIPAENETRKMTRNVIVVQSEECLAFVDDTCLLQEPHLLPQIHPQSHTLSSPKSESHWREDQLVLLLFVHQSLASSAGDPQER